MEEEHDDLYLLRTERETFQDIEIGEDFMDISHYSFTEVHSRTYFQWHTHTTGQCIET